MQEPSIVMVVIMGLVTVFIVLICIILIIALTSVIIRSVKKDEESGLPAQPKISAPPKATMTAAVPAATTDIGEKQRIVAAVSAAIAEDMGTDVSHIKIHSLTQVGNTVMDAQSRQRLVAAVSAAIAEDMGTEISNIRIHSLRRI